MVLPTQPKSMIVVGSGAIGVEFAYFYNSMGTKVTIVEFLPRIVPVEDEDISKELEKQYKKQGIDIMTNASVESVDTSGAGVKAKVKTQNGEIFLEADLVLSAVGVVANIENIGLEELGIKTEKERSLLINIIRLLYQASMQLVIVPLVRHWHTWQAKKELLLQNSSDTMRKNGIIYLKPWTMEIFRDVLIALQKSRAWA